MRVASARRGGRCHRRGANARGRQIVKEMLSRLTLGLRARVETASIRQLPPIAGADFVALGAQPFVARVGGRSRRRSRAPGNRCRARRGSGGGRPCTKSIVVGAGQQRPGDRCRSAGTWGPCARPIRTRGIGGCGRTGTRMIISSLDHHPPDRRPAGGGPTSIAEQRRQRSEEQGSEDHSGASHGWRRLSQARR